MSEVLLVSARGATHLAMADADLRTFVIAYNDTAAPYPSDRTVVDLIRDRAAREPAAEAIRFGTASLSYGRLDDLSDRMAARLVASGAGPGRFVVLLMEHSIEVVVAILGILKSGAAYVPLDAVTPPARIATVIKDLAEGTDGRPPSAVTQTRLRAALPADLASVLVLDADFATIADLPPGHPSAAAPDGTAYVIFTSGSTGTPKGVEISHRSLMNYVWWAARAYSAGERLTWPLFSSLAFDLTVTTLFVPLITGGRIAVYLGDPESRSMVVLKVVEEDVADIVKLTPSHLSMIRDRGLGATRLRKFVVGGEDLKTELARAVGAAIPHPVEIYNEYGPTEATVGCMIHRFDPERDLSVSVPIGVPAANAAVFILDAGHRPVPQGVVGEMFVAGDGLAKGYFNRPDLTAQRFPTVADPRDGSTPLRLYRTGDLARWSADGRMEFLGRADHQVKVAGTRIELGEIEARLLAHPRIDACAVSLLSAPEGRTAEGGPRLVAHYVASRPHAPADLRAHLAETLIEAMIPAHFVHMERMPLTSNGKIDRSALPAPTAEDIQPAHAFAAPEGETERALAALWSELLGIGSVGRGDNFFDLGGESLMVVRVVSRMRKLFGVDMQVRTLFERPTLAGLAEAVDAMRWSGEAGHRPSTGPREEIEL